MNEQVVTSAADGPTTRSERALTMQSELCELERSLENSAPLVLVDSEPFGAEHTSADLSHLDLNAIDGVQVDLVGEVRVVNEHVVHGRYSGRFGRMNVLIDQFVEMHNCIPRAVVRVITRLKGPIEMDRADHLELALSYMGGPKASRRKRSKDQRSLRKRVEVPAGDYCSCRT